MKGKIIALSGPTVTVRAQGLSLYEKVSVGSDRLTGEVVKLEKDTAVIQVYEDTRGLAVNEVVEGSGSPLTVSLGPGLLSSLLDGLQRPLRRLRRELGHYITGGKEISALDRDSRWDFSPLKKTGATVAPGEALGYVTENGFIHRILYAGDAQQTVSWIGDGSFGMGEAIANLGDGRSVTMSHEWPVRIPRPYRKKMPPAEPLVTGQRSIDFLFPLSRGGTAILPGGFGTGKTILEQSIAKFADVDIVVYAGCGERGNEMAEMIEEFGHLGDAWTGRKLMERTVLVVNTSNMPVSAREASIFTAVTIAEYYRDMGYHVLLLADSISRWAEALREIASSLEEMPGEEGYPTYLSSRISGFLERAGTVETLSNGTGSLTMVLSVSPPGGDFTEPVTQACMRTAGSFLMLDTSLAHRRHFPAINWLHSYSLYEEDVTPYFENRISPRWRQVKARCREILQEEEALREVVEVVGVEGLQDSDRLVIRAAEQIRCGFLCQDSYSEDAFSPPDRTMERISHILDSYEDSLRKLEDGTPLSRILSQPEEGAEDNGPAR